MQTDEEIRLEEIQALLEWHLTNQISGQELTGE